MASPKSAGLFLALFLIAVAAVEATETENLGVQIVPTPGKVTVDGKADDWDLSGGVFACSDVENLGTRSPYGFMRCTTPTGCTSWHGGTTKRR